MNIVAPSGCETAARYALIVSDPDSSGGAIAEAMAWVAADERHKRLMDEAMRFLGACDRVAEDLQQQDIAAALNLPRALSDFPLKMVAIAASIAVLVAGLGFAAQVQLNWPFHAQEQTVMRNFASRIGETRTIRLSDRDSVTMGGDTAINVSYGKSLRHIAVVKGQALLKLSARQDQDIAVDTGTGSLHVATAEFDVERNAAGSTVTVVDGSVLVDAVSGQSATPMAAGMQMTAYVDGTFSPITRVNADAVTSWCNGLLQFAGEQLSQVVEKLNRYSRVPIVVSGDDLGRQRVSGVVEANKIDEWLSGLVQILDIDVVHLRNGPVVLRPRRGSAQQPTPLDRNGGHLT